MKERIPNPGLPGAAGKGKLDSSRPASRLVSRSAQLEPSSSIPLLSAQHFWVAGQLLGSPPPPLGQLPPSPSLGVLNSLMGSEIEAILLICYRTVPVIVKNSN